MQKQQKILVVGDQGCAESVFGPVDNCRHQLTYCTNDDYGVVSDKQNGHCFDWILIKGAELAKDKTDLIRSLRAMGSFNSMNGQQRLVPVNLQLSHSCGIEWAENGTLILRCCRQPGKMAGGAESIPRDPSPDSAFVFEYHAPVKKTG